MMVTTAINISAEVTSNFILGGFVILMCLIALGLYLANKDPNNSWSWLHLVQDNSGYGSLVKFLQFIGGMTGTFVIVFQTVKNVLTAEMFMIYLAALGVSEGFSKWVAAKYNTQNKDKEEDAK